MRNREQMSAYARRTRQRMDYHNRCVFRRYLSELNSRIRLRRLKKRLTFRKLLAAYSIPHPFRNDLSGTRYVLRILRRARDMETDDSEFDNSSDIESDSTKI